MTISVTGVSVDTGVPAQNLRAQQTPVISAAGINDQAAIARQQLASAVPAPALIAAYSTGIQQQPKPAPRLTASAPSSSLAAQFIAQDESLTSDDLAIFEAPKLPTQTTEQEPAANDFLNDLRIARGDFSAADKTKPTQANTQAAATEAAQTAKLATTAAAESTRSSIAQFASALPALFSQLIRRPSIVQAKGVVAYQLAEARNAATRTSKVAPEPEPAN